MKNIYSALCLALAMLLCTQYGWAQGVTTSSLTGIVTDSKGAGLPGATVVAVHTPSGTQYGTATNVDGRFNIVNMRVGGPYTINISYLGFQTSKIENVTLKLAEPFVLNASLSESGTELKEVVISGTKDKLLNAERSGAVTNVGIQEIQALPTISRSLNDFTRLTPQANGSSVGGGNYRQNQITVDGADFNNNFGIGSNLPAGGSPISLDAIEEISVNVTPFDVRQSGFIGSAVNAITRSGSNNFSGSLYSYYRTENQQGSKVGDFTITKQDMQFNQYGFRVGGPILKNKLFFFINGETEEQTRPGQARVAATAARPYGPSNPDVARPTEGELDNISNYLRNTYGYETGPYQGYDFVSDKTKFLARLDWNITNNHRFNIRYSQVESKDPSFVSSSRSPLQAYSNGFGRTNNNALHFRNSNYYNEANFYSLAAELNSNLGGMLANTFRATYTKQNDPRSSDSSPFPFVDILKDGQPFTSFGYEPFTYGNLRDVEMYSFVNNLTWIKGAHNFTFGAQADFNTTKNGFQRFATSYYTFRSWDDFVNGVKPLDFGITYSLEPGFAQAFPTFKFAQYSAYAQDEVNVTERLKVTGGLRLEYATYPEALKEHPLVSGLAFAGGEKLNTANLPKSALMFSPRAGFNWDVKGDRSVQLRGGTGIFTGKVPFVWIVSQAGDAGMLQITQQFETDRKNINDPSKYETPGPFNPNPAAYRPETVPTAGTSLPSSLTVIDENFKMPQTWKTSFAVDAKLPFGIVGTLEGIYNKDLNTAIFRNPNLVDPTALNIAGYPDNRMIYPANIQDRFYNPATRATKANNYTSVPVARGTAGGQAFNTVVLDNGSEGHYWSVTAKLEKQFANGLSATAAYVKSAAKNQYDGSGDQPLGAWGGNQTINGANFPELSHASYVVPDRVIASLSFRKEYFRHLGTTVSLFYEGSTQGRFSYVYSNDFNRDGQNGDLIYIPRDASEITFVPLTVGSGATAKTYTAKEQSDLFFAYIEQDDYLRSRKGQYAERNGALMPWRNQFDFKLLQDVFTNIGGKRNTLQFSVDIFNVGNFINSDWGVFRTVNASSILTPTNVSSLNANGTTVPTFRLATFGGEPVTTTFSDNRSISSTYYMQFGLRYIFN
ncbi:TonB-dependent receptor [Pontibacter cellulosilyticus]|uniref:TonB-dependent receptor n=1 Tax=Pontibacter cellulosilyticus TaxID=1720253 RepID=A0A923SJA8_9BACT|nr:TonB-dependent receptor [Pontibacter cellulosilyticus]MBC5993623.1 TonB-dependent receptor [Pontibacter cellulosilyticus]